MNFTHPIVQASEETVKTAEWFARALTVFNRDIRSPHFLWGFGILYETIAICWLYFKYKLYEFILLAC